MLRRSVTGSPPYPLINSPMFNAWAIAVERGEKRLILTKHFDVFLDKRLVLCMKESTDFPLVFTIRKRTQFSSPWYHRVFFVSNHISTKCGPRTRNVARNVAHYAARYVLCRNSDNHAAFQPGRQILHVPNFNTSFKTHCKFSTCNICLSNWKA